MSLFYTPWEPFLHIGTFPLPRVRTLCIPGAPEYLQGLKLLFISDVHLRLSVSDEKLSALTKLIAGQKADLLLLGGDYGEGRMQCQRFFHALKGLSFPLGAYGVPGNNDCWDDLEEMMAAAGITLLRNHSAGIDLPGGRLQLGGCDEYKTGMPDTKQLFSGEGYRILLSHFPTLPDCACDLMLSGHTHGGQINFLGLTPYSLCFERRYKLLAVRGTKRIGNMQLAICSGIGVSRLPLRMGAVPEILAVKFGG